MTRVGWIQILVYALAIAALTKPLGAYMYRVFEGGRRPLQRFLGPIERAMYRLCGVDPRVEQTWGQYAVALLVFSAFGVLVSYVLLRLQGLLPWNPAGFPAVGPDLAFNTAASFTSNTNC